jgi:hypothetical protein
MTAQVIGVALRNATQAMLANALQVSTIPATLYGISGYNSAATVKFIQLHDSATAAAEGATPVYSITVPATSNFNIDFGFYGMSFLNGVYACNSSTAPTKTIGAADCQFFARSA